MPYTEEYLKEVHEHCRRHRDDVEAGKCGCFYCLATFDGTEVSRWIDRRGKQNTALCPRCGIDAVLPAARNLPIDDPKFLEEMYRVWFETTCKPGEASA